MSHEYVNRPVCHLFSVIRRPNGCPLGAHGWRTLRSANWNRRSWEVKDRGRADIREQQDESVPTHSAPLKLRGRSVGIVPLSHRAPPSTEAMGHLAWGGSAILSITNRTICLNKRKQKLQRVAGAPQLAPNRLV
jgi:hypothetical protein